MSESEGTLYCVNHPKVETMLRCNRCGNPICPKCAVRTPVGFRCKQCIKGQQAAFYSATPLDYVIAVVIGLVASTIAAFIIGAVGLFFTFFLAPVAGGAIAEVVRWATGRRRGRWMWLVVSACIVVGALIPAFGPMLAFLLLPEARMASLTALLTRGLYVVLAIGVVYARLR
jgi:MFS family permease